MLKTSHPPLPPFSHLSVSSHAVNAVLYTAIFMLNTHLPHRHRHAHTHTHTRFPPPPLRAPAREMPDTIEGYGHYAHRSPHTPPPPVYVLADHHLPYPHAAADAAAASARRGGTPAEAVRASGPAYPYAGAVARGYASPSGSGTAAASPPSPRQAYDSAWRGGASSPHVHVSPQTRRAAYGAPDGASGPSVNYPAGYPHHSSPQHPAHHHSPGRVGGGVALHRQPLQTTAAGAPPPAHNFGAMRRRRVVADAADPMATGRDTVSQQELDRSQLFLVNGTQYSDLQNSLVSARHIASKPCVCAYRRPPPQPQAEPEGPIRYDAYGNPIEDKLYYAVDGLMQCVACETPMFDTAKYCPNCATKVFLTCPRPECGQKTRAPSPRCDHCYCALPQEVSILLLSSSFFFLVSLANNKHPRQTTATGRPGRRRPS